MEMKKVNLVNLPYKYEALEPVISRKIMELHHKKHHQGYVNGTNAALDKLKLFREGEKISLRPVLRDLSFHMNGFRLHNIFWTNMTPPIENNAPTGVLADMLDKSFGSFDIFKHEFSTAAKTTEGSGWAVLATNGKRLLVNQIEKHNLMHVAGFEPVLVLDVWEHAYYADYLNRRGEYIDKWWQVVNWNDVEKRIKEFMRK